MTLTDSETPSSNLKTDDDKRIVEQAEESEAMKRKESSLYVVFHTRRPAPDEIRRLHPKITDVRVPRSKSARYESVQRQTIVYV